MLRRWYNTASNGEPVLKPNNRNVATLRPQPTGYTVPRSTHGGTQSLQEACEVVIDGKTCLRPIIPMTYWGTGACGENHLKIKEHRANDKYGT